MKKVILLLIAPLILFSCSKDDGPDNILDPWQQYFKIEEGETKVEIFKMEFQGTYSVNYTIYDSELDEDFNQVKKEVVETGTIEVDGSETFQYNSGFVIFGYEIRNLEEEGHLKLFYNNVEVISNLSIDELNSGIFELAIPYKYETAAY